MAETDFGALVDGQKKVWSLLTWKAGRDASVLMASNMIGREANRPVQLITELTNDGRGDKCVMQLVQDLIGDGVVDDNELEGNEEAMANEAITLTISQLRHGVKSRGRMSEQKNVLRFREQARDKLGFWFGDRIDELAFLTLSGRSYTLRLDGAPRAGTSQFPSLAFAADVTAPTTNRQYFCGAATSTATLATTDKITWNDVISIRAKAERSKMKPMRMKGKPYYILLLSTEGARDLMLDNDYKSILSQAGNRGEKNPLFTGEIADINGTLIYSCNKICSTLGAASGSKYGAAGTVNGAQFLFLGGQALGFAKLGEPTWDEADNTDYKNRAGIGHGQMFGFKKPVFNSLADAGAAADFSVFSAYAATAA